MGTKLGMQVLLSFPGSDDRCYFGPQIHARRFVFRPNRQAHSGTKCDIEKIKATRYELQETEALRKIKVSVYSFGSIAEYPETTSIYTLNIIFDSGQENSKKRVKVRGVEGLY
ncbi:hypothetical protein V2G26_002010 [Clonostachys chloroleuca]